MYGKANPLSFRFNGHMKLEEEKKVANSMQVIPRTFRGVLPLLMLHYNFTRGSAGESKNRI